MNTSAGSSCKSGGLSLYDVGVIFQLDSTGFWSDVGFVVEWGIILLLFAFAVWYILKKREDSATDPPRKIIFRQAIGRLFSMFWLMLLGVVAGGGPYAEGFVQGRLRNQPGGSPQLLACAIITAIVIPIIFVQSVIFGRPVAVSITPQRVELIYTLPWRHQFIDLKAISQVKIECKNTRDHGVEVKQYSILVSHEGKLTRIESSNYRHNSELKNAFAAIRTQMGNKRGQ